VASDKLFVLSYTVQAEGRDPVVFDLSPIRHRKTLRIKVIFSNRVRTIRDSWLIKSQVRRYPNSMYYLFRCCFCVFWTKAIEHSQFVFGTKISTGIFPRSPPFLNGSKSKGGVEADTRKLEKIVFIDGILRPRGV
jgi:hypothetical protein